MPTSARERELFASDGPKGNKCKIATICTDMSLDRQNGRSLDSPIILIRKFIDL